MKTKSILIKDTTKKMDVPNRQFIRVAIKSKDDNNELCDALSAFLQSRYE